MGVINYHQIELANSLFDQLYRTQSDRGGEVILYEIVTYQDMSGYPKARIYDYRTCSGVASLVMEDLTFDEVLTYAQNKLHAA